MPNIISRKLIVESPNYDLAFEGVQQNRDERKRYYINGEYLMMNKGNKNRRIYEESEMLPAIDTYKRQYIAEGRGGGELNHSATPDVDLAKLADKIISLERSGDNPNYFIGKSLVLSTPSGRILEGLIEDGVKFGKSSKCLGQINESADGYNRVKAPIILTIDNVFDPSVTTAFVDGIYENREYIIADDGRIAEAYSVLDKKLAKYPGKHSDAIRQHLVESLQHFLKTI